LATSCDPVYEKMIEGMLSEHAKDPMNTSLVVINSYDYEKEDIEDIM
jgi:hypothetical protein